MSTAYAFRSAVSDDGPGGITPSQWLDFLSVPTTQGPAARALGIVQEAWLSALRPVSQPVLGRRYSRSARREQRQNIEVQREARQWFFCDDSAPFTFCYLAAHLGLDVSKIRHALTAALAGSTTPPPDQTRVPVGVKSLARSLGHHRELKRGVDVALAD